MSLRLPIHIARSTTSFITTYRNRSYALGLITSITLTIITNGRTCRCVRPSGKKSREYNQEHSAVTDGEDDVFSRPIDTLGERDV